ncbi:hypothetical protein FDP41_006772 [Naegleria fowleri]|uniref:Serine/threonine-protein phosphatase 4 regulatory subunit 3-like central domain-containing protein n=1 Tax=Naegleria fowleri TaxID=5763 RepID=A0A6A5BH87_NAEFO|nr:uncharacterized protein FDP41_006772 [Naegleria fowleri]KAF0974162.1 hypothetical protein FDP41_006772 [Naegleria fowleri]CAG4718422.1 unnamed protein product [Naegleria fowleri]
MSEHNDEFFDEEEEELHENESFTSIWDLVPGYSQSPLDSMVENEDTTLEQVLDEDTLIQELKSANHKVIAFLSKDENVDKLIQYISQEEYLQPGQTLTSSDLEKEEEETLKRTYKYPFITSEIFNCDIEEIVLSIVKSKEKTIALFSYLQNKDETKTPKNPSLSQYFVKAVSNLLQKYYKEIVDTLMEKHSQDFNILKTFFTDHIGLCDMDTLVLKVLGFETSDDNFDQDGFGPFVTQQRIRELFLMKQRGNDQDLQQKRKQVREWAINNNFLNLILTKLEQSLDNEEVQRNVFSLLSQIVEKGYSSGNELTIELLSEQHLNNILDIMFKNTSSTILVHGIPFLRMVISVNEESYDSDDGDTLSDDEEGTTNKHSNHSAILTKVLPTILSRTKQFLSLLNDSEFVSRISKLELSHALLDPPLGETRLKVVEHLLTIFKVTQNNPDYQKELVSLGVMGVLIDLFFTYEYNSMLHVLVFDMIKIVMTGTNTDMKLSLLQDTELCQKILKAVEKNKAKLQEPKGSSLGYMGFLIDISNLLKKTGDANTEVAKYLSGVEGWKEFTTGFLQERNLQNEKQLGGPVPIGTFGAASYMGEEDDDDDYGYDEEDSSDSDEEVIVRRTTEDSDSDEDEDGEVVRRHY